MYKVYYKNGLVLPLKAKTEKGAKIEATKLWSYGAGNIELAYNGEFLPTVRKVQIDGFLTKKWTT